MSSFMLMIQQREFKMELLFTVGLLSTIAVFSHARPHCDMTDFTKCVSTGVNWWHNLPKRPLPMTEEALNVMCTEIANSIKCGSRYKESCMTRRQLGAIRLVTEGLTHMHDGFCRNEANTRNRYLKHAECFNRATRLDAMKEHLEYMTGMINHLEKVPFETRLEIQCCSYVRSMDGLNAVIRDNCGQEAVDTSEDMLGEIMAQFPSAVCKEFDPKEDRCKAAFPPPGTKASADTDTNIIYLAIRDLLKNFMD